MITGGMMTSNSGEWETPQDLFNRLNAKYNFTLDPCATAQNAKCDKYFTKEENGLIQSWMGETVFMNPPYGRQITKWVKKAFEEWWKNRITVVCLLPARTDTDWFHAYCLKGKIEWIRGRLKFSNNKWNAPFPSMLVIFRADK